MRSDRAPDTRGLKVALVIGSATDREAMAPALALLVELGIDHELKVLSAHRTPEALARYAQALPARGFGVVIAAAGLAAHLAGTLASRVQLPVIGVPMEVGPLKGLDALLSTVQMPAGIPVAAMAIGKAGVLNSVHLAARILALSDRALAHRIEERRDAERRRLLEES